MAGWTRVKGTKPRVARAPSKWRMIREREAELPGSVLSKSWCKKWAYPARARRRRYPHGHTRI